MPILLVARLKEARPVYGVLVDDTTRPATILGVTDPLISAAQRRRFLAGTLPPDSVRAAWAQRQQWAFPILAMRWVANAGTAGTPTSSGPVPLPATATYRQESVRCGKPTCSRCQTGPGHGPYWYAYWHEHGRLHKRYLGASFSPPTAHTHPATPLIPAPNRRHAVPSRS